MPTDERSRPTAKNDLRHAAKHYPNIDDEDLSDLFYRPPPKRTDEQKESPPTPNNNSKSFVSSGPQHHHVPFIDASPAGTSSASIIPNPAQQSHLHDPQLNVNLSAQASSLSLGKTMNSAQKGYDAAERAQGSSSATGHEKPRPDNSRQSSSWAVFGGIKKLEQSYEQFDNRNASQTHLIYADGDMPKNKVCTHFLYSFLIHLEGRYEISEKASLLYTS